MMKPFQIGYEPTVLRTIGATSLDEAVTEFARRYRPKDSAAQVMELRVKAPGDESAHIKIARRRPSGEWEIAIGKL